MIKRSTTILNIYDPINITSKYLKQKLIELLAEIDKIIITVGDFSTPLSRPDRINEQKISSLEQCYQPT